jgi:hypothetical protein
VASLTNFLEALNVLSRYGEGPVEAANQTILAGGPDHAPSQLNPGDRGRLAALGWSWDDLHDCWVRYT